MRRISGIFFSFLFIFSCKVDPKINNPLPTDNLVEIIPAGWPQPVYTFSINTISQDKFVLGRALFYETMLSRDNSIACASCHQQFVAFANADHPLSHGLNGLLGKRNAPAIFNVNWIPLFMHDGGINQIENQPVGPITNPVEMAEDLNSVMQKLQASAKYKSLFTKAYGTEEVSSQKMMRALAQFMGLIYSNNSKYDYYKRGENNVTLSPSESHGYNLFLSNCNICHKEPLFSDYQFRNNGLPVDAFLKDSGRAHITRVATDIYRFKTPSLRNIAKTGPYMHDGRFTTLEECLDHYTNGITNLTNLDPWLETWVIQLSPQDKTDIIAFLNTLTDYKFINDKKFSDPNF
jgi:cytochrome c peroxidase